jgi:hypothetical protein
VLHDVERSLSVAEEAVATGCGWNGLIVSTSGPEEVAKFTMFATEAIRGFKTFEAADTSDPTLDAPMVLLKTIVIRHDFR